MSYAITTATKKILQLQKRIKAVQGGTSAGKTIGIEQVLIDKCQRDRPGEITSVVSESFPHLKRGAIRDFLSIMETQGYYDDARWNRSDYIYTFETGAKLEFFSADQPSKVRGPRRKRLFMNEANNMPLETFDQLEVRTLEEIYLDWNPTVEFWFYDIQNQRDDIDHLILTYKDNEALDPSIVKSIEQRKGNKAWWQVYGLGLLGEVETRIFRGWQIVDEIPFEARLERTGLDFGYTNDPTAIIDVYYYNGGYILDEVIYQNGLLNKAIADILKDKSQSALVIADAAEPKSIDEIRINGVAILPAKKGQGSILQGIQYVQGQKISVTKRSVNLIKEYRNYVWITDPDGRIINEPVDFNNHAMDAVRYAFSSIRDPNQVNARVHYPTSALPRNNLNPTQITPGAPPELQDKPRIAPIHRPNL